MKNLENREWVSIVECISARATCIQPLIIFEGIDVNINWAPDDPPPYKYTADPTAWVNDDIALWWLQEIFLPHTKSTYRIVLFDNPNTHLSSQFGSECKKRRFIIISLPGHTPDVLQPLDLVMFSPIEGKYKDKLYQLCHCFVCRHIISNGVDAMRLSSLSRLSRTSRGHIILLSHSCCSHYKQQRRKAERENLIPR
jgi:hypothetical protein